MNIEVIRGDDETLVVTITNPDGSPYNLTDADLHFTVRGSGYMATPMVIEKGSGDGITAPDPETGVAFVALSPSDTDLLSAGRWQYDVEMTANDRVTTVASGYIKARADVTPAPGV